MNIDKGIPIPPRNHGAGVYGFGQLETGDSIFFSGKGHNSKVAAAARKWNQRHESKMVCRREGDGIRIWRTE